MSKGSTLTATTGTVVGLDLSDRQGTYVVLDAAGLVAQEGRVPLTDRGLRAQFGGGQRWRIALEVGPHSPWVSRLLAQLGHEVIVANPRQVALIYQGQRKTDRLDAEHLARLARLDPTLLHPLQHRGEQTQHDLAVVRSREALVGARTALINHVRSVVKSSGARLPACGADQFATKGTTALPAALRPALGPVLDVIADLTSRIHGYDRQLATLAETGYPATRQLQQVHGVGPLTALSFVLTIEEPGRFRRSRDVAAYLGLTPRKRQSGAVDPQLHISKAGDAGLRRLLVQCAHYILGPFGKPSDLRTWGTQLMGAGGSRQKRRAVIAVARKLAVLLHRLWVTGQVYEPVRAAAATAA